MSSEKSLLSFPVALISVFEPSRTNMSETTSPLLEASEITSWSGWKSGVNSGADTCWWRMLHGATTDTSEWFAKKACSLLTLDSMTLMNSREPMRIHILDGQNSPAHGGWNRSGMIWCSPALADARIVILRLSVVSAVEVADDSKGKHSKTPGESSE